MSAPESDTAVVPVVVEENKPTEMPAIETKVEEPATVIEAVAVAAVEAEGTTVEPATEEMKAEAEKKDVAPKSPSLLAKIMSSLKVKGPKKEKKKEEVEATAMEAPKEVPAAEVPAVAAEVPVVEMEAEPVATEAAAPEIAVVAEEVKEETPVVPKAEGKIKAMKVSRRLSARVGDFFSKKPKAEVQTPAKVDEHPPMIDTPMPVAPLENPASEATKVEEPPKPVEVTPVVAAAA